LRWHDAFSFSLPFPSSGFFSGALFLVKVDFSLDSVFQQRRPFLFLPLTTHSLSARSRRSWLLFYTLPSFPHVQVHACRSILGCFTYMLPPYVLSAARGYLPLFVSYTPLRGECESILETQQSTSLFSPSVFGGTDQLKFLTLPPKRKFRLLQNL